MSASLFIAFYSIAILVQSALLMLLRKEEIKTRYLQSNVLLFIAINIILLIVALTPQSKTTFLEVMLRLYYIASFFSAACFLSYATEICVTKGKGDLVKQIEIGVWIIALCSSILAIFTDEIVKGHSPRGFTITAVPGDTYWISMVHGFMAILTATVILFGEWLSLASGNRRKRCLYTLMAYLVHALCALAVALLMRNGAEITFAVSIPFSTTIFLFLIVYGDFKYAWDTVPNLAPRSESEPRNVSENDQLIDIFTKYTQGHFSFNEATEKMDYLLLTHSYNKHNGNMLKAAKEMGLGRSTLYKKVQKHNLR